MVDFYARPLLSRALKFDKSENCRTLITNNLIYKNYFPHKMSAFPGYMHVCTFVCTQVSKIFFTVRRLSMRKQIGPKRTFYIFAPYKANITSGAFIIFFLGIVYLALLKIFSQRIYRGRYKIFRLRWSKYSKSSYFSICTNPAKSATKP